MGFPGLSGKRGLSNAQVVFDETFASRNFNTSPLTIPDLRGDLYDYEILINATDSGANNNLRIWLNNDSTSNYRSYSMRGVTSSASASVNDSVDYVILNFFRTSQDTLGRIKLTGSSGFERYMSSLHGSGIIGSTVIDKVSSYWKNTADDVTSLVISDSGGSSVHNPRITVFATPKDSTQEGWELIREVDLVASTGDVVWSGLNGDVDGQYRVTMDFSNEGTGIQLNGDGTSNYQLQSLRNISGAISANNVSNTSFFPNTTDTEVIINAVSGVERLMTSSGARQGTSRQYEMGNWWGNTADNVTSVTISNIFNITGTAKLYRRQRPNHAADTLPWETVDEVAVSGDFSSGHTFTGLQGDLDFMYKVEFEGDASAGVNILQMRFNGDATSSYVRQELRAVTSSVSAQSSTLDHIIMLQQWGAVGSATTLIYPKTGNQRPLLNETASENASANENLFKTGNWWTNTGDDITSILVLAQFSTSITGTLRLSRIRI